MCEWYEAQTITPSLLLNLQSAYLLTAESLCERVEEHAWNARQAERRSANTARCGLADCAGPWSDASQGCQARPPQQHPPWLRPAGL